MATATVTAPPIAAETPLEQLESLCDAGSFRPLRSGVSSTRLGERAAPGDGVVAGAGEVNGRPVFCYSQDPKFLGGSLGEVHAETIVRLLRMAGDAGAPVVGFVRSGGARLQEGHAALSGYGRIFRASVELSRKVPQVSIVSGISAGGGAYSPALTDFVAMTAESRMFLTGPKVVQEAMGEEVSMEELGGPRLHGKNGVCHLLADDVEDAIERTRHLLGLLPQAIGEPPALVAPLAADGRDPGLTVPGEQRKVYDVRDVARSILDQGSLLELSPRWAPNMVTGIARLEGRSVGLVANQPRAMGGVIDAAASEKAALFVNSCDRFRLPLLVFVDTPGFLPGKRQEEMGVIRHGASLLRAFAGASVPKVTLVLRKAFGGAAITMNSKDLGADLVFSWPGAQIGIMAARQAVGIVHGRALREGGGPSRDELADAYAAEHLTAPAAAASGWVDEVIDPSVSRDRLAWALRSLGGR
ncbi:MAG TPA: carboxyl transferase domain-containing protein [Solirubrobacterales bacterium]|jgi:acetyl-CoA carboxylase carboxyltransferase component|nr:carboxyl transferase domain-containing protein [Solirubrobacterales bacterium]